MVVYNFISLSDNKTLLCPFRPTNCPKALTIVDICVVVVDLSWVMFHSKFHRSPRFYKHNNNWLKWSKRGSKKIFECVCVNLKYQSFKCLCEFDTFGISKHTTTYSIIRSNKHTTTHSNKFAEPRQLHYRHNTLYHGKPPESAQLCMLSLYCSNQIARNHKVRWVIFNKIAGSFHCTIVSEHFCHCHSLQII